ncbi:MAG TPA: hypothetical protein VHL80_01735 [Polyangia bacterium]|nr:hypothetical protein [Polyangia bacterium]
MKRPAPRRGAGPLLVAGALAALAAGVAAPPRAEAYVRYKTTSGVGFFWPQSCVPLSAYPLSLTDASGGMEMTTDQIMHAATAAAATWSSATMSGDDAACTYIKINVTEDDAPAPTAALDYTNALVFDFAWCHPDKDGGCSYPDEALAITSVFVNKAHGQILDGDIEVNAKSFVWADLDLKQGDHQDQDLQNALTHEMGHLIGLDHTCFVPQLDENGIELPRPTDNLGNPVPDCDAAPLAVQQTTMFPSASSGDVSKRTLAPDDIQGVCGIYPLASDPMICPVKDEPPPKSGCALARAPAGSGAGLGLAVVGLVSALGLSARRRRRPRP